MLTDNKPLFNILVSMIGVPTLSPACESKMPNLTDRVSYLDKYDHTAEGNCKREAKQLVISVCMI